MQGEANGPVPGLRMDEAMEYRRMYTVYYKRINNCHSPPHTQYSQLDTILSTTLDTPFHILSATLPTTSQHFQRSSPSPSIFLALGNNPALPPHPILPTITVHLLEVCLT